MIPDPREPVWWRREWQPVDFVGAEELAAEVIREYQNALASEAPDWERALENARLAHAALGLAIDDGDDYGEHVGLQRHRRAVHEGQAQMLAYFDPPAQDAPDLPKPMYGDAA